MKSDERRGVSETMRDRTSRHLSFEECEGWPIPQAENGDGTQKRELGRESGEGDRSRERRQARHFLNLRESVESALGDLFSRS